MSDICQCQQCVMSPANESFSLNSWNTLWTAPKEVETMMLLLLLEWHMTDVNWMARFNYVMDYMTSMNGILNPSWRFFLHHWYNEYSNWYWWKMHYFIKMRINIICLQLVTNILSSVNGRFIVQQLLKLDSRYIKQQLKFGWVPNDPWL